MINNYVRPGVSDIERQHRSLPQPSTRVTLGCCGIKIVQVCQELIANALGYMVGGMVDNMIRIGQPFNDVSDLATKDQPTDMPPKFCVTPGGTRIHLNQGGSAEWTCGYGSSVVGSMANWATQFVVRVLVHAVIERWMVARCFQGKTPEYKTGLKSFHRHAAHMLLGTAFDLLVPTVNSQPKGDPTVVNYFEEQCINAAFDAMALTALFTYIAVVGQCCSSPSRFEEKPPRGCADIAKGLAKKLPAAVVIGTITGASRMTSPLLSTGLIQTSEKFAAVLIWLFARTCLETSSDKESTVGHPATREVSENLSLQARTTINVPGQTDIRALSGPSSNNRLVLQLRANKPLRVITPPPD